MGGVLGAGAGRRKNAAGFRSAYSMSYEGTCNGCGKCCTATHIHPQLGIVRARCCYLVDIREIGQLKATLCSVYERRVLGMPITMMVDGTNYSYQSSCYSTYPNEQDAIPPECSYLWQGQNEQPRWHLTYAPKLPLVNIMEK